MTRDERVLFYFNNGMTRKEIAEKMEMGVSTVSSIIREADPAPATVRRPRTATKKVASARKRK